MKIEDLAFPATLEEAGAGRKLEPMEREALGAWLPLFNMSFADGLREDCTALASDLAKMDGLIAEHGDDEAIADFLKSCRWWIPYAWERGRQDAGKAVGS